MPNGLRICDLNNQEKPREKLVTTGEYALTDEELLAIILRSGGTTGSAITLARNIIKTYGSIRNIVSLDFEQLRNIKDIGPAKATSIKALGEISKRITGERNFREHISTPKDVYKAIYTELYGKQEEYLYILILDSRNKIISKELITKGTVNQSLISSRDIYKKALAKNATSIILIHNHPSNDPTPSKEDIIATEMVAEIGKKIGIPLLDHLIFADTGYTSMKSLNLFNIYKVDQKGGE